MWFSQLGQTIQPSDVMFNLTKFSNTLSVGIVLKLDKILADRLNLAPENSPLNNSVKAQRLSVKNYLETIEKMEKK